MKKTLLFVLMAWGLNAQGAQPPYASETPLTAPRLFAPGEISTPDYELNAAFTPDGRTVYFTKSTPQFPLFLTIVVSHFVGGKWTTPEVAPFSGQYSDADPFVSPDGKRIFFASMRPVDGKPKMDNDLWMVEKTDKGWSEPRHLGPLVNSSAQELYPSVSRDGTLYFASGRPGGKGGSDIWCARLEGGVYGAPENLGDAINTRAGEGDACISADGDTLVFTGNGRPDDMGGGDLYVSERKAGTWTPARHLASGINTKAREFCPIFSPDQKYLFFTTERGFGDAPPSHPLTYRELEHHLRGIHNHLGNVYQVRWEGIQKD